MYEKLPADIAKRYVLLLDPVLGTGNTACKAIQVRSSTYCRRLGRLGLGYCWPSGHRQHSVQSRSGACSKSYTCGCARGHGKGVSTT